MAVVSSHILDAITGTDARGIKVEFFRLDGAVGKKPIFEVVADEHGRISMPVVVDDADNDVQYELVFHTADYFKALSTEEAQIMHVVVIRMTMPDPNKRYHVPLVLSPHSYTIWWSG